MANNAHVSEVEVSTSTVMLLNERSTPSFNKLDNIPEGIFRSVKINASIVPMLGKIIPEPFAIPAILILLPSILHVVDAPFEKVSVVRIAFATSSQELFFL